MSDARPNTKRPIMKAADDSDSNPEETAKQHAYFDYGRRVDKSLGRKSKSDSSDSDGGMSSDSWEEHANAHNKYWEAECEVRVRTSGLTKKEVDMLMLRGDCTPDRQAVVENPINHVNAGPVCTGWVLDMLEEGTEGCAEMQLGPGEKVPTSKALWSLLKVIMNSERKADQFKSSSLAGCRCLNASYFMPHGCSHTKPGMSGYIMGGISMQLCSTCSKCLRCGGYCKKLGALPEGEPCSCQASELDGSFLH